MEKPKPDTSETARMRALAHPLRQKILGEMIHNPQKPGTSPSEMAAKLDRPLSNVSYHVRTLADCGAITLKRTEPVRGSMRHFYVISPRFIALPWVSAALKSVIPDPSQ